jgi:hypothetical protein
MENVKATDLPFCTWQRNGTTLRDITDPTVAISTDDRMFMKSRQMEKDSSFFLFSYFEGMIIVSAEFK